MPDYNITFSITTAEDGVLARLRGQEGAVSYIERVGLKSLRGHLAALAEAKRRDDTALLVSALDRDDVSAEIKAEINTIIDTIKAIPVVDVGGVV
jgi:hypothetical protein